jgi:hypothetical protein
MNKLAKIVVPMLCVTMMFSCKATKESSSSSLLPDVSAEDVLKRSAANRHYGELSSKVNITYSTATEKQSFSARVRMKQDSVIWVSIAPLLGIEMVRAKITPDSLMLVDRFNKRFYLGKFERLSQMLKVELTFAMLQSLLTGTTIELYRPEQYRSQPDQRQYLIEVGRPDKKQMRQGAVAPAVKHQTWIDPQHYGVTRSDISDAATNYRMEAEYSDFLGLGPVHFPEKMAFRISTPQQLLVDMQWVKPICTSGQEFPFSVPEKYEPIQ